MIDIGEQIFKMLGALMGISFLDFVVVWLFPFTDITTLNQIRVVLHGVGLVFIITTLIYVVKNYRVNKKTKEILEEEKKNRKKDRIWESNYSEEE